MKGIFYDLSAEDLSRMETYANIVADANAKRKLQYEKDKKKDAIGELLCLPITLAFPLVFLCLQLDIDSSMYVFIAILLISVGLLTLILSRVFGGSSMKTYKKVIAIIAILICAVITFICEMDKTEFLEALPIALIPCVHGWFVVKFIFF